MEYGNVATDAGEPELADDAYQKALQLETPDADRLIEIGHVYTLLRRPEKAMACFARATAMAPKAINPRISQAVLLERQHRLDEARDAVEGCLALDPHDEQARYFSAVLDRRAGNLESAERALRDLIGAAPAHPVVRHSARYELAQVLDQTHRPDEAMRWLDEAKALSWSLADIHRLQGEYDGAAAARRKLCMTLPRDIVQTWSRNYPSEQRSPIPTLALLGGHPRSGTTLLERVLAAHPAMMAVDESQAFAREILGAFMPTGTPLPYDSARLNALSTAELNGVRQGYLKRLLLEVGHSSRGMIVDKNPSATLLLPLWLRVFPELRVLIALRDPRDVVLSCYFQNIPLNAISSNFLTLQRTARHYADLMDIWLAVRQWDGVSWLETRYEDVVADLEQEGARVTQFLGLPWHPDQARFHEKDPRKPIHCPTYQDVTRPVYSRSIGRWHAYERYLAPVLPMLDLYIRTFQYDRST
jgi:tetratricopeptide (TPR) repeat protein